MFKTDMLGISGRTSGSELLVGEIFGGMEIMVETSLITSMWNPHVSLIALGTFCLMY